MQKPQSETQDQSDDRTLEDLVKENLYLSREIFEQTKKVRRYILVGQIFSVIKTILIIGPIIVAIIYLPPLIRELFGTYSALFGAGSGNTMIEGGSFVQKLFESNNINK